LVDGKAMSYTISEGVGRRGIINTMLSFGFYDTFIVRYNGFVLDPNRWSFCLLLFYILVDFNRKCSWEMPAKIVISISLICTLSRAGIGAWIIYLLVTHLIKKNYCRVIIIPSLIVFSIGLLLFTFDLFDLVYSRLTYGITGETGTSSRGNIWVKYVTELTATKGSILLGKGVDMDPSINMGITPHNALLYIGYQFGLVLSFLYLLFILAVLIFSAICKRRDRMSLNIGFFLLLCMTLSEDYLALPYFWFIPTLFFSQLKIERKQNKFFKVRSILSS